MSLKKRNNKFFRLKSHVWSEVKDKNLYDYRSKNFNKLVRQIYEESGKKGVTRQTGFLIEKVEKELFFKPPSNSRSASATRWPSGGAAQHGGHAIRNAGAASPGAAHDAGRAPEQGAGWRRLLAAHDAPAGRSQRCSQPGDDQRQNRKAGLDPVDRGRRWQRAGRRLQPGQDQQPEAGQAEHQQRQHRSAQAPSGRCRQDQFMRVVTVVARSGIVGLVHVGNLCRWGNR